MIRDYIYKIITKIKQMAHKSNYIGKNRTRKNKRDTKQNKQYIYKFSSNVFT